MDRRVQKTRTAICNAFGTLLTRKRYSQITVQEIIDAANVGRSTFYAHFAAKEDLLKEICTELFAHIFQNTPVLPDADELTGEEEICRRLEHILLHMGREGKMLGGVLRSESGGLFLGYFRTYMDEFTQRYILSRTELCPPGIPQAYLQSYLSGSFVETVQWWFSGGMQPQAGEMARQYCALVLPGLRSGM